MSHVVRASKNENVCLGALTKRMIKYTQSHNVSENCRPRPKVPFHHRRYPSLRYLSLLFPILTELLLYSYTTQYIS